MSDPGTPSSHAIPYFTVSPPFYSGMSNKNARPQKTPRHRDRKTQSSLAVDLQHSHRIDSGRSAGGEEAGGSSGKAEKQRCATQGARIG